MTRRGFWGVLLACLASCKRSLTGPMPGRKPYEIAVPIVGVVDNPTGATPKGHVFAIANGLIRDEREGVRARVGLSALVDIADPPVQGGISFRTTDGTAYTFIVSHGKVYRVSTVNVKTDVTPVGPTIANGSSPYVRVYMAMLADKLYVSDGVNPMWVGTNLSSTPITGATLDIDGTGTSKVYGRPFVYYAKLGVINGKSRNQWLWSEENNGTIGYNGLGGAYLNVWNLAQTDTDPLFAFHPLNDTLLYFRENSWGRILGRFTDDYQTDGVQDSGSQSVGCTSPGSICDAGDVVFFVDQNGLPQTIRPGTGLVDPPLWKAFAETARTVDTSLLTLYAQAAYSTDLERVMLLYPTDANTFYVFDAAHNRYHGYWTHAIGSGTNMPMRVVFPRQEVTDGTGDTLAFVTSGGATAYLCHQTRWTAQTWFDIRDPGGAATGAYTTALSGPMLAVSDIEQYFDEQYAVVRAQTGGVALSHTFSYTTPRGAGPTVGTGAVSKTPAAGAGDVRIPCGVNAFGRWFRPTVSRINTAADPVWIVSLGVYGQPEDASPTRP